MWRTGSRWLGARAMVAGGTVWTASAAQAEPLDLDNACNGAASGTGAGTIAKTISVAANDDGTWTVSFTIT